MLKAEASIPIFGFNILIEGVKDNKEDVRRMAALAHELVTGNYDFRRSKEDGTVTIEVLSGTLEEILSLLKDIDSLISTINEAELK